MRCTQCGFTTFDHLEACPKCRADLYGHRTLLNLPAGPLRPISLTEIMARVEIQPAENASAVETVFAPAEKTAKIKAPVSTGPKTFDLDLSGETAVENLSSKWLAKAGGTQGQGGEPALNLTLE